MELRIEIPDQDPRSGQRYSWDDGYALRAELQSNGASLVTGNAEGLRSLARHLLVLSLPEVPSGSHLHLDEFGALEDGSGEIIVQRDDALGERA